MRDLFVILVVVLIVVIALDRSAETNRYAQEDRVRDSLIFVELARLNDIVEAQAKRIARTPYFDKDSIGIGYRGTLYSKYHRKYKLKH